MSYEEKTLADVTGASALTRHNTETSVRSFLGTILAPAVAIIGLLLVSFAPSPSEIAMGLKPIGQSLEIVNGDDSHERESIQSLAGRLELAVAPELGQNTDCFDDLRLADDQKLERCGRLVYKALAEVNEDPSFKGFPTDVAQSASPRELMQELKLAATEVCRERWSREGAVPKDSPACDVALAQR
jgi:hypothetical protein